MHGIVLADGRRLVLRQYRWRQFLVDEPDAPRREVAALRLAWRAGLPVPEVVASAVVGGVPVLLMSWLPGRAVGSPDAGSLAAALASVHAAPADGFEHAYSPWYRGSVASPPPAATWPALWERAIELWRDLPPYRPVFVHRDFHPGNVLWSRGRLTGIVDWANACRGPIGCDLAHCAANLRAWAGDDAATGFLAAYRSLTGQVLEPFWEMASILEHSPSGLTPAAVAAAEPRLAAAVSQITGLPPRPRAVRWMPSGTWGL